MTFKRHVNRATARGLAEKNFVIVKYRKFFDKIPSLFLKVNALLVCRFGNTYGYGFAFARDSPYTPLFKMELFRLQNDFIISSLTHKWTEEKVKCELMDNFEEQQDKGKPC